MDTDIIEWIALVEKLFVIAGPIGTFLAGFSYESCLSTDNNVSTKYWYPSYVLMAFAGIIACFLLFLYTGTDLLISIFLSFVYLFIMFATAVFGLIFGLFK